VIDDDDTVREVLRRYLMRDGHDVLEAADGSAGLELAVDRNPDQLVLDLMLPGRDGLEVCRQIRRTSSVPIIMLTALGQVSDRVVGLEFGADDYVVKPFSPRELALRVGRVLDRSRASAGPAAAQPQQMSTTDGEVTADATSRIARCRGREISLTSREFDLLFPPAAPGPGFRPR
jgi:DNA-binding response OmpR family regulator